MTAIHPVDEILPTPRLAALGLQHVLVMYAGAVAVPLIVGRALKLPPEDVAFLISADLFCCGLVTLIQSLGATQWFGVRLPVMMGVTFASVAPMVAMANAEGGPDGARLIFGSIIGAGLFGIVIAPFVGRMLKLFPPVVTGSIILVIGVSLMRIGINWIFGNPVGPTAPSIINPEHAAWLDAVKQAAQSAGTAIPAIPEKLALAPSQPNPIYAKPSDMLLSALVLLAILTIAKFGRGFLQNIAVLLGILFGGILAVIMGKMSFAKMSEAAWFGVVTPFHFGMPRFDALLIITMCLVMIVVMIESSGMFLALGEMTGKKPDRQALTAGLRTDGLGTLIGGIFNTFPYTSFSQNVGLVGVTGIKSRFVCVAGGVILIIMSLIPKLSALVEALPTAVLGGAGLVMFGMVAATGIRILSAVEFKTSRNNLFIVAISLGLGMIPLIAPNFKQWLPSGLHPLIESGILLATVSAVLLNAFFNGTTKSDVGNQLKRAAFASGEH